MRRPPGIGSHDARILLRRSSEAPKSLFAKLPLDALDGREADVMVEAKGKEQALVSFGIGIG
jgi:hypothetical protein